MIYVSKRVGKDGKVFNFYKFRSMRENAEEELKLLLEHNEIEGGVIFKMKEDPRITKFGKFLRKTSLDELPQLFNILKGDMSLVGPRPCTVREYELYSERDKLRLKGKGVENVSTKRKGVLPFKDERGRKGQLYRAFKNR